MDLCEQDLFYHRHGILAGVDSQCTRGHREHDAFPNVYTTRIPQQQSAARMTKRNRARCGKVRLLVLLVDSLVVMRQALPVELW